MRFCVNCRARVEGSSCPNCGTPADAVAPKSYRARRFDQEGLGGLTDEEASALCYFGWFLTGLLFTYLEPYKSSKKVRFHAMQSILLSAFWVLVVFSIGLVTPLRHREAAFWIVQLLTMAIWLGMMWSAWRGKDPVLPVLGPMAEKHT